ncbi:MAG: FAD-dependent oxidoreductase [Promethearchaeati archaeon SRVP18_Atabeyarchaeia-1]
MKVAILGGGLTGLTLACLLQLKGIDFTVLEKENECGGLMRSLIEDGLTFDYGGSHILFSKDKEALDFLVNPLMENRVTNRRNTKVLYKDRYVKYPFENGLSDLPTEENFECLYGFIQTLVKREKGELEKPENLRDWFYYTFGKGIAEKYMVPYNEKIWKYPTERISLEWVERIPHPPIEDIVKSSLGIQTEGYVHQLNFQYPVVGGIQAVIAAIEVKVKDNILRQFSVKKVRKEGRKWIVSDDKGEVEFDKIISTIPIHDLMNALKNGGRKIPSEAQSAVDSLKYNSLLTVMIGVDKPKLNNLSWLYVPGQDALTHRVSFPSNFSPKASPEGKSSVMAEITCNYGEEIWRRKDEDLVDATISDLHKLKIINKEAVCFAKLKRSKYAYVISDLDFQRNMGTVERFARKTGIDLVGRFSEFRYMNMDACVRRAMDYATSLEI